MRSPLYVLLVALITLEKGQSLKCYRCRPDIPGVDDLTPGRHQVNVSSADVTPGHHLVNVSSVDGMTPWDSGDHQDMYPCSRFDPHDPNFQYECPNHPGIGTQVCFSFMSQTVTTRSCAVYYERTSHMSCRYEAGAYICRCKKDFCNSSGLNVPSAFAAFVSIIAIGLNFS